MVKHLRISIKDDMNIKGSFKNTLNVLIIYHKSGHNFDLMQF